MPCRNVIPIACWASTHRKQWAGPASVRRCCYRTRRAGTGPARSPERPTGTPPGGSLHEPTGDCPGACAFRRSGAKQPGADGRRKNAQHPARCRRDRLAPEPPMALAGRNRRQRAGQSVILRIYGKSWRWIRRSRSTLLPNCRWATGWRGCRTANPRHKKARSMSGLCVVTWRSAFQVTEYGAADGTRTRDPRRDRPVF